MRRSLARRPRRALLPLLAIALAILPTVPANADLTADGGKPMPLGGTPTPAAAGQHCVVVLDSRGAGGSRLDWDWVGSYANDKTDSIIMYRQ